jgi:hypothetical protein
MKKELIEMLINKYNLRVVKHNGVDALLPSTKPNATDLVAIKDNKTDIINYLLSKEAEERKAAAERMAKIEAIEGLKELENAIIEWNNYSRSLRNNFDNEYKSSILPTAPKVTVDELKKKYPRAAAYLLADNWSLSNNYKKADAGRKALEKIINGDDYDKAIEEMKAEFTNAIGENWD